LEIKESDLTTFTIFQDCESSTNTPRTYEDISDQNHDGLQLESQFPQVGQDCANKGIEEVDESTLVVSSTIEGTPQ